MDSSPQELVFLSSYLLTLLPSALPLESAKVLDILATRFVHHWHPLLPERGSGFRAISFEPCRRDGYLDPVLSAVAQAAGWSNRLLRNKIVQDTGDRGRDGWTIFVDPGCVCVRGVSADLRQLWGTLPQHLRTPPHMAMSPIRRLVHSHSAPPLSSPGSVNHSSPLKIEAKQSRAVPILAPTSALRNAGFVKMGIIPPTPLSHQESAVFSRASSASPSRGLLSNDASNSWNVAVEEAKLEPITPLQLLAPFILRKPSAPADLDTLTDAHNSDPFHRPSSRSSSGSGSGSEEYASDASLFSNDSSTTSNITTASDATSKHELKDSAAVFTPSQGIIRNKPSQMVFLHQSSASLSRLPSSDGLTSGSTSPSSQSVPDSPRKLSGGLRGRYNSVPITHVHSSSHGLVLKEGPGTVTEHSGGKVGVMGGGVLLGVPKSTAASPSGEEELGAGSGASSDKVRRRGGRRGRGGQQYTMHHQGQWPGAGLSISSVASFTSTSSGGSLY